MRSSLGQLDNPATVKKNLLVVAIDSYNNGFVLEQRVLSAAVFL
jgi:hypothetical protein